jgi:peptide chain release factor subunit 1
MPKTTTALEVPLQEQLDRLAAFEPAEAPVLSLYLDLRPDQHGHDRYDPFLRKLFRERSRTFTGGARKSFERDVERMTAYLANGIRPSSNGAAIFACAARAGFFEAIQLGAPVVDQHWLFVAAVPHLYPLARLIERFPRYAALLVDTNSARLFVFSLGAATGARQVEGVRTRRTSVGGWSQARYQRHVENFHLHHMKEVIDVLDKVVTAERLNHIVAVCEEVARPLLMEHLPPHLAARIIDAGAIARNAADDEILVATREALRRKEAGDDDARVRALLDQWRPGGLAVAGPEDTLRALAMGQVEELLITATPASLERTPGAVTSVAGSMHVDTSAPSGPGDLERLRLAGELVTRAHRTGARIRFVEKPELLSSVGGAGALLRFRLP